MQTTRAAPRGGRGGPQNAPQRGGRARGPTSGANAGARNAPARSGGREDDAEETPRTSRFVYRFSPNAAILQSVLGEFARDPRYATDQSIENFRGVFQSTLTVGSGAAIESTTGEAAKRVPRSTLVLRSFRNVLDAVAKEQRAFDSLAVSGSPSFLEQIPARQRRPIIRTDWSAQKRKLLRPVAKISYAGASYQITDEADSDPASLDARWNRDVFRLLIDLSAQVTVDITKFQRQVLELNQ
jgi:hypothetical protein